LRSKPSKACEKKTEISPEDRYLKGTNFINADSLSPIETAFFPSPTSLILSTPNTQNHISRLPVWTFVAFAFEHDLVTFWHTGENFEGIVGSVIDDLKKKEESTLNSQP
jgi:hypothetical protein